LVPKFGCGGRPGKIVKLDHHAWFLWALPRPAWPTLSNAYEVINNFEFTPRANNGIFFADKKFHCGGLRCIGVCGF
jgi:hypothetical protein